MTGSRIVKADPAGLAEAAAAVRDGRVVCFPTESFYGLAVRADDADAVTRLCAAKGRAPSSPIACLAASADIAARIWAEPVPPLALALAKGHWPGALTIVAPARAQLAAQLVGAAGVGVRVTASPFALAFTRVVASFVDGLGAVITATSANRTGAQPSRTVADAKKQLGQAVDLYLDGGVTPGGEPSTVVEVLASGSARVVRSGALKLTDEELRWPR